MIPLKKSFQWYDVHLKVRGNETFAKRYAGRVETGAGGKTDPLLSPC